MNSTTNETSVSKERSSKIDKDKSDLKDVESLSRKKVNNSKNKADRSPARMEEKKTSAGINNSNLDVTQENVSLDKKNRSRSQSVSSKKVRNKSQNNLAVTNKKMKKHVNFKEKNFLDIVQVESYKKYNVDMSYNDPNCQEETTRCRCVVY